MASEIEPRNPPAPSRPEDRDCCCDDRCSTGRIDRRGFLGVISAAATAAFAPPGEIFAGPFEETDTGVRYRSAIPADKKLADGWVRSLFERGTKDRYSEPAALRRIGMPVGGLFAGTVYLGGDGRLWLWDILNRDQEGIAPRELKQPLPIPGAVDPLHQRMTRAGLNYLEPAEPYSPFEQGFELEIDDKVRSLNATGFSSVTFDGRYPIGRVDYTDPDCPVEVTLEAFSPFIPLEVNDSSLPATVLRFRLKNRSERALDVALRATLENPVGADSAKRGVRGLATSAVSRSPEYTAVVHSAKPPAAAEPSSRRPDIVYETFESDTYGDWSAEGTAFGAAPVLKSEIPDYQGDVGGEGERVVNSHASAPGSSIGEKDAGTGTLTSPEFKISRRFVNLFLGGGGHAGKTSVKILVDGETVASASGRNENRMRPTSLLVHPFEGKIARIQICDHVSGGWGNIGIDHIVFSDTPVATDELAEQRDFGSIALAHVGAAGSEIRATSNRDAEGSTDRSSVPLGGSLVGRLERSVRVEPGREAQVDWIIAWHFPNLEIRGLPGRSVGHAYAARFSSAEEVIRYVAREFDRLTRTTREWVDCWYDSTLPYWLLDRTMANTSTLATTTCYRLRDGRFWAWEGIGCCPGTCTHVWHYAQAPARLFPEIERDQRERVDFGDALHADGGVGHREYIDSKAFPAVDGHCGRILGAFREHQMAKDDAFLRRIWPRVRKAVEWLIAFDKNSDGVLEGAQHNTLDAAWYGKIPWLISLYLAALRAGAAMARERGDPEFASRCDAIASRGAERILDLWGGEYFIHEEDPKHSNAIGTGTGCHIDQLLGQTWAHWTHLGTLFDREKQLSALRALWKYNFAPDVGAFRERFPRGRWYAAAGDAGLVMCTWPRGGEKPGYSKHWQYGYFNECMTGFEWQVAAHMIWEGADQPDLLLDGLAIARAIHDRYRAERRNPYNEIECSDHYSRAMASFGVYQAVCGLEYHGPNGHLAIAPRIRAENFRASFVAAEGWGTIAQTIGDDELSLRLDLRHGALRLQTIGVHWKQPDRRVQLSSAPAGARAGLESDGDRHLVRLGSTIRLEVGEPFEIRLRSV